MKFPEKIEKIRLELGMSKQFYCERVLKIPLSHYSKIMHGDIKKTEEAQNRIIKKVQDYLLKLHNRLSAKCISILLK